MPSAERPPTTDELRERMRVATFWIALVLYFVVAGGGAWLFWLAVHDAEWLQIFGAVWWAPAGAFAWWAKHQIEQHLFRWVVDPNDPDR